MDEEVAADSLLECHQVFVMRIGGDAIADDVRILGSLTAVSPSVVLVPVSAVAVHSWFPRRRAAPRRTVSSVRALALALALARWLAGPIIPSLTTFSNARSFKRGRGDDATPILSMCAQVHARALAQMSRVTQPLRNSLSSSETGERREQGF